MEKIENLKSIITSNLIKYRKQAGLTQAQLASKLGYSDKTVSKWEREEGVPDIYILKQIADLYNITVNDLISSSPVTIGEKIKEKTTKFLTGRNKLLITLLAIGIVWFVAVTTYVILDLAIPDISGTLLANVYVYAIPISCIVAIVFNSLWGKKRINCILVSALIWTTTLSLFLTLKDYLDKISELFIIAIPLQVLTILFFLLEKRKQIKETNKDK
ncbi:MAG: helix-turn-helix transcriptional regulator [Bacilli bacterium]|nr:helix-turn-helix transcriptional regulator [Bacilli bacterium]